MAKRRPSGDGMVRKWEDSRMTLGERLDRWLSKYKEDTGCLQHPAGAIRSATLLF